MPSLFRYDNISFLKEIRTINVLLYDFDGTRTFKAFASECTF